MTDKAPAHGGWSLLGRQLARRWRALVRMSGWSAVEALPALTSGLLVSAAADHGFLAGRPWIGLTWLAAYGLFQIVRAVASGKVMPHLAAFVEPARDAMVDTVVSGTLRRAVHGERPDASAITRLTEQIQSVRGVVSALLLQIRTVVLALVAAVAGLTFLAPVLGLMALAPVVVCVALFVRLQRGLRARQRAVLVADERIAREASAALEGMRDVVACGAADRIAAELGSTVDVQAAAERRLAVPEAGRLLILSVAGALPLLAVLAATPWLIRTQHLTTGQILGAVTYVVTSLQPALAGLLGSVAGLGLELSVTLERIASSAAEPEPGHVGGAWPQHRAIDVEELTFTYGPAAQPVVSDLTMNIADGEHLAIVGPSGIGKSTLACLLAGLIHPTHGGVHLGGFALDDIDERWMRRNVALIPQEAYVFAGSLRDNLTYLAPNADDAALERAVDTVGLRPMAERLGGYDARLGAGELTLSEGERQLIALTRVYLSRAHVVILDEGTCHLDPALEARAEQAFRNRNGTLIVIAHRISSALRADRILVLDGQHARIGTHKDLMATSPAYRELLGYWTAD